MKQTVEEAAKEYADGQYDPDDRGILYRDTQKDFIAGAEWQAKQSPWISVEDRLPDNQDIVLVRDEYDRFCIAYLHSENSGFITYGEDAYNFFGEITHWIPIPKFDE